MPSILTTSPETFFNLCISGTAHPCCPKSLLGIATMVQPYMRPSDAAKRELFKYCYNLFIQDFVPEHFPYIYLQLLAYCMYHSSIEIKVSHYNNVEKCISAMLLSPWPQINCVNDNIDPKWPYAHLILDRFKYIDNQPSHFPLQLVINFIPVFNNAINSKHGIVNQCGAEKSLMNGIKTVLTCLFDNRNNQLNQISLYSINGQSILVLMSYVLFDLGLMLCRKHSINKKHCMILDLIAKYISTMLINDNTCDDYNDNNNNNNSNSNNNVENGILLSSATKCEMWTKLHGFYFMRLTNNHDIIINDNVDMCKEMINKMKTSLEQWITVHNKTQQTDLIAFGEKRGTSFRQGASCAYYWFCSCINFIQGDIQQFNVSSKQYLRFAQYNAIPQQPFQNIMSDLLTVKSTLPISTMNQRLKLLYDICQDFTCIKKSTCDNRTTLLQWFLPHVIENKTNRMIMKNIISVKQCNWKECKRKDTKLHKCKRCKSVYYCSKICQKKDWNVGYRSHRAICKKNSKRDYTFVIQEKKPPSNNLFGMTF